MTEKDKIIPTVLDKSEFFSIGRKTGYVDLPGGKRMKIQELSSDQRIEFGMENSGRDGRIQISDKSKVSMAKLVMWGAITEDGSPIFTEKDISTLRGGAGSVLDDVASAILGLSGMRVKQVESAAKN